MSDAVTAKQCAMARAGLEVHELASRAGVHDNTIWRFEDGHAYLPATAGRIQAALESGGAVFLPEDDGVQIKGRAA